MADETLLRAVSSAFIRVLVMPETLILYLRTARTTRTNWRKSINWQEGRSRTSGAAQARVLKRVQLVAEESQSTRDGTRSSGSLWGYSRSVRPPCGAVAGRLLRSALVASKLLAHPVTALDWLERAADLKATHEPS